MGQCCAAVNCNSSLNKCPGMSFFHFPRDIAGKVDNFDTFFDDFIDEELARIMLQCCGCELFITAYLICLDTC